MITEKDLQEAIAECEGERRPTANTCLKLAAFYTIREQMYKNKEEEAPKVQAAPAMSFTAKQGAKCDIPSDTEFADLTRGMPVEEVLDVMDELMSTLQVTSPRLYAGVLRKLNK